jgi:outer membrane protein OmpA-like peptidoglycan-associated protein
VDVFFNEQSAEVTSTGQALQGKMVEYLGKGEPPFTAYTLGGGTLQKAQWVVLGSFKFEPQNKANPLEKWVKISTEVKDINTDKVLAKADAFVNAQQFSASSPIKFYKDAPMYMKTEEKAQNQSARSPNYGFADRLKIEAKLNDGRSAYDGGDYVTAENIFKEVSTLTNGKNVVALSGIYQSQLRESRLADAESSFGRLAEAGLDAGSLSVKFLFKVGSTEFLQNEELATQYPLWIRQIALQLSQKKQCMVINGHASRSGSAEYNTSLSRQRAEKLLQQLKKSKPVLASRLQAVGKGFSENIVGAGTNDALDAIDRRVDFELVTCK